MSGGFYFYSKEILSNVAASLPERRGKPAGMPPRLRKILFENYDNDFLERTFYLNRAEFW